MEHKTLFQRLNPDVLVAMYQDQEEYPYLISSILEELHNNYFVSDLKFGTVMSISSYCDDSLLTTFSESNFYQLFN
jgi:hypothetical protein